METAAGLLQRRPCLAKDGDGVKIIELLHIVVEIAVIPLVGRGENADVLDRKSVV